MIFVAPKSLTTRLVLSMALILAAVGYLAGVQIYNSVGESIRQPGLLELKKNMAWLAGSVEIEDGVLDFESRAHEFTENGIWRISLADGRVLWESNWAELNDEYLTESVEWSLAESKQSRRDPGPLVVTKESSEKGPGHPAYRVAGGLGKIDLTMAARTRNAFNGEQRARLALSLWMNGVLAFLALVLVLGLFVRWQLAPLGRMSKESAAIGPENTGARIGPAGTSVECVALRESVNTMVERLAAQLERERQFASMAAHELRTPLAQLRTSIEVALRRERDASEYRDALSGSLLDIARLQKLIENLLFLVRNHDGIEMTHSLSLRTLAEQAARDAGSAAQAPRNFEALNVHGNSELLGGALRNVLDNAARYAPGAPPVLSAAEVSDAIELAVTDAGPGVPESEREKIFEPLTRLDQARSIGHAADGFGLGLTVARAAVKACGGNLFCRARADGKAGAEFVFALKKAGEAHSS